MRTTKHACLSAILIGALLGGAPEASAMGKKKNKEEPSRVVLPPSGPASAPVVTEVPRRAPQETVKPPVDPVDYDQVLAQVTATLSNVSTLIQKKSYGEALTAALAIVKDVENRAGIRSKTPNLIDCGEILDQGDLELEFSRLPPLKQIQLSRILQEYKKGRFLDLLNVAKRASALYLRALYLRMNEEAGGRLTDRDVEYIKGRLLEIQEVKIYFISQKLGQTVYLAFDSDLLEPNDIYMFNRELLDVVLEDRALQLDQVALDELLRKNRQSILKKHWDTTEFPPGYRRKSNH